MPEITDHTPGVPSWVDLMSPDVDASKEFYGALFDWDLEDQHDDDGERVYVMASKDGRSVAGIGGQMPGMEMPPVWNTYLATMDADASAEAVEEAGGEVQMAPMEVFDSGRMAVLRAPDGAAFSVWEAGAHAGAEVANEHGTWTWSELLSRDLDAATPFYEQAFGWGYDTMDNGEMGPYHIAMVGEQPAAGLMTMPPQAPDEAPSHWSVYFAVDDLDAAIARAEELGGQAVTQPIDTPQGRTVTLHDPDGGSFALIQFAEHDDEA